MALTSGTLIADAELLTYPYIPFPRVPRAAALRALQNLDAEVVRLLIAEVPHTVSVVAADITIVLATNPIGYTLEVGYQHQQFTYVDANDVHTPIKILTMDRLDDRGALHPAAIVLNNTTFFPIDPLGKRWVGGAARGWYKGDGDKVLHRRVNQPSALTSLTIPLTSPDFAQDYFLRALRLMMLLQYPNVPEQIIEEARARVPQERLAMLDQAHKSVILDSRFGEKAVARSEPYLEG